MTLDSQYWYSCLCQIYKYSHIDNRLRRDIKEPKNVKLLFDVLRFEPPAIHRAVLFVTNNALVCETPEDASRVAYDLDRTKNSRYDVRPPPPGVAHHLD